MPRSSADLLIRYNNDIAQQRIEASLPILRGYEGFRQADFVLAPPGDMSAVLMADEPKPVVVKHPLSAYDSGRHATDFEAEVVAHLEEASDKSRTFAIPGLVNCRLVPPYHLAITKVPGEVLSHEAVRHFGAAEQQDFGCKTGEFTVWMNRAMDVRAYRKIAIPASYDTQPDRLNNITYYYKYVLDSDNLDATPLAEVLIETYQEMGELKRSGELTPTIVGHDDLRPGNITFKKHDGLWLPHGIFDFGLTKLSSPEREFRHIAPLGRLVLQAAVDTYEAATGTKIRPRVLQFWAVGQAATAAASLFVHNNPKGLAERVHDLRQLLPDKDWSRLEEAAGICN